MTAKPRRAASKPPPGSRPRWALAATVMASSMGFIDGSVVNVGLPAIQHSLKGPAADLPWVVNAYLLPLSALMMFGGALGDRFGHKRLLCLGAGLFAAGSLACALAPSLDGLILARAFQGLAAAIVLPNSLAALGECFDGEKRGRAVGMWAAAASIASAIGPVLGGWLIDQIGWRAIFVINIPLAFAAIGVALYALPAHVADGEKRALDLAGACLATAALTGLVWGLTTGAGAHGWTLSAILAVGAGAILAAGFVLTERRLGERAMTPLALFASRPLLALNGLTLLLYGALNGFNLLLPYALITSAGYSATAAGAALLPIPIIMGVLSPFSGSLSARIGPRPLLLGGTTVAALGCALAMTAARPGSYWIAVFPGVAALVLGMSFVAAPLTAAVLGSVDKRHTGIASGLNSALAQLGGVIAIALIGAVLAQHGAAFVKAYSVAALAGAGVSLAGAACILLLLRPKDVSQSSGP